MSDKSLKTIDVKTLHSTQFIDITDKIRKLVKSGAYGDGICCIYIPHTTAAVTINENADPDVRSDIIRGLKAIVSEDMGYKHMEGNSPAHIRSSLIGNSVNVIVENGDLVLGTWQGIYFCEFDGPRSRKVYVKIL